MSSWLFKCGFNVCVGVCFYSSVGVFNMWLSIGWSMVYGLVLSFLVVSIESVNSLW